MGEIGDLGGTEETRRTKEFKRLFGRTNGSLFEPGEIEKKACDHTHQFIDWRPSAFGGQRDVIRSALLPGEPLEPAGSSPEAGLDRGPR
jgi:hypothetical protein